MLTIDIDLLRGIYEAGGESDGDAPEWPPHPARVFNALVAAADHDDSDEVASLGWIERAGAPSITAAAEHVICGGRSSFVPTNKLEGANTYTRFPARKALGPRTWSAVSPRHARVSFTWNEAPDGPTLAALSRVVRRVGYLGRSVSPVACDVHCGDAGDLDDGRAIWRPGDVGPGSTALDVAHDGYLRELIDAFVDHRKAHEVQRRVVGYRIEHADVATSNEVLSPYAEVIVVAFADGRRLGANSIVTATARLREAIQAHTDGGPLVLRGHRRTDLAEGQLRHQIAIVGLPFVGSEHATGQVFGLAVIMPRDIADADRRQVLGGLAKVVRNGLNLGRLGVMRLDVAGHTAHTLQPDRWAQSSTAWVSATPISANRFTRHFDHALLADDLRASIEHLDLPQPTHVDISKGPIIRGTEALSPSARLRHARDRATPSYHARLTFPVAVRGPLLIGSMRRYGLGLMVPS
jgi:CRISPR-associated protein Csb2